jgi:hypothetical protein
MSKRETGRGPMDSRQSAGEKAPPAEVDGWHTYGELMEMDPYDRGPYPAPNIACEGQVAGLATLSHPESNATVLEDRATGGLSVIYRGGGDWVQTLTVPAEVFKRADMVLDADRARAIINEALDGMCEKTKPKAAE